VESLEHSNLMKQLTDIVREADLQFGLRAAIEKLGFPQEEDVVITFQHQDIEVKTEPIVFASSYQESTTLNKGDLNTVVLDWLNQAEQEHQISSLISQELKIPKEGDVEITIQITSKSNRVALTGLKFYCPCPSPPPFPPACCWRN
jgi:hypothetical protein